jgi:hypothetical protein
MALFYRNRPDKYANETELVVAEYLEKLDDSWQVVWGYYYKDDKKKILREGDFIILGPGGQMLVMEVKGGQNRQFVLKGEWELERDGENPLDQLYAQWEWAYQRVGEAAGEMQMPWIEKALCMPNLSLTGEERLASQFDATLLILRRHLEDFEKWWKLNVAGHQNRCSRPESVFVKAFVPGQRPTPANLFIKETDRILDRYRSLNEEYLEMLEGNDRWVVEGGPGTGKSFLAMQRVQQLAEQGRNVLFLCYNLHLAAQFKDIVGRLKLTAGSITVKSWEELAQDILIIEGLNVERPESRQALTQYFENELPAYVSAILKDKPPCPTYDALVVDEAQDHDTAFREAAEIEPNLDESAPTIAGLGWWSWYFALLKNPQSAPVGIFLDPHQRPRFRPAALFNLSRLRAALGTHAHFRLTKVRRYTRKVDAFLRELDREQTHPYQDLHLPVPALPTGPDVLLLNASPQDTGTTIGNVLREWIGRKFCKIDDIIILGPRRRLADSSIGPIGDINGYPLCDYTLDGPRGQLQYMGLHSAKGLDFLGVILIDLTHQNPDSIRDLFTAATRARQLLAIIKPTEI